MNAPWAVLSAILSVAPLAVCAAPAVFDRPAGTVWQDGLYLGNGRHGVLAYQPAHLEWVINRHDLSDRRVPVCEYATHAEIMGRVRTNAVRNVLFLEDERRRMKGADGLNATVSAAILRVRFWNGVGWSAPAVPACRQVLDTERGELLERMEAPVLSPQALTCVPHDPDVVAIRLSDADSAERPVVIELARPDDPRMTVPAVFTADDGMVSFEQKMPFGDTYAVALHAPGATADLKFGSIGRLRAKGRLDLYVAVRASRTTPDPLAAARAAVRQAASLGFDAVRQANAGWWRDFWRKGGRCVFASEPEIDRLWRYSCFALAGQFAAAPMPALNGLTFGPLDGGEPGVGAHAYVHDQNAQIPLLPSLPVNQGWAVRTFAETYLAVLPELRRRTREQFGADGVCLPVAMNADGVEYPMGGYRYSLCGSAYAGLVLARAWRFMRDEDMLRTCLYPLLREFLAFYVSTSAVDDRGVRHTLWSVPPEIHTGTRDDLATLACLKPCLEVAVEASERFGCDADERAVWKDWLAHYPPFARQSGGGWWGGPEIPDDHYAFGGHLFYPFFPAESCLDAEAARRTLAFTVTNGVEWSWTTGVPHADHEWTALYTGVARQRLNPPADGWQALQDFRRWFVKSNGLVAHNAVIVTNLTHAAMQDNLRRAPCRWLRGADGIVREFGRGHGFDVTPDPAAKALACPVLEGSASLLLLATETLLQSWGGTIRLFPCVPPGFTGEFENLRAEGGRLVSAKMENGRLVSWRVTEPETGGEARPAAVVCGGERLQ